MEAHGHAGASRITVPSWAPWALLGVGLAVSAALLIVLQSRLTFFIDDWDLLLHRRGFNADAFLDPHARHLIIGPAAIYKAVQATVGMNGQAPYAVISTVFFVASLALLFAYARQRVGDWLALAAIAPIAFMGTAWEDLLSPFQMSYFGSIAFGIGALFAFRRADRRGDVLACLLLLASLAFAEIAVPFALGIAVAIALERSPWRRLWIVAVPLVLYALWYLGWQQGPSELTFGHVATSPVYVLDGLGSSVASLLGLGTVTLLGGTGGLDWGRPLLVGVAVAAAFGLRSRFPARGWLLVVLAIGLSFWFLTAANAGLGRPPYAARYQYVGAVFLVLIGAEYAAGWRPGWRALAVAFAISIAACAGNISSLHQAYRSLAASAGVVRGDLAGLEIARDTVDPGLVLTPQNSDFSYFTLVDAGSYLSAERKFGSPAYTEAELATAPEPGRVAADKVLAAALRLTFQPLSATPPARGGCRTVSRSGQAPPVVELPRGGAILTAPQGVRAKLSLQRFATASFPIVVGTLKGAARLAIPQDRSSRPWQLQVDADGPVTVCPV